MAQDPQDTGYLADRVREADPERYLSVLYAPADKRTGLLALYAFNAEIAHIRDVVREPIAGEIRLQWWREALSGERRDEASGNPFAAALIATVEQYGLPRAVLDRYLKARLFDLYDEEFPDRNSLEGYCGETAGAIIQLAAMILDPDAARSAGEAAGHAACAQAITGLLRALPVHRARGQCYVPAEILKDCGTNRDAYLAGRDKASAGAVKTAMTALARDHLDRFKALAPELAKVLLPAYLPLAPVSARLSRIDREREAALDRVIDITPLRRNWLVMWRAVIGF